MEDICVQRLENLKQIVLLNYLDSIDFEKSKDFYNILMEKVFHGDFDYCFLSKSFAGADEEEKKEVFHLARKYQSLCFYKGDFQYWADSIGGVYASDLDFVSMRVLDHYDFLLGLVRDFGEDVLKLLKSFENSSMSLEGSVIDYLRNCFENDDLLKEILMELSKEDGDYKDFNLEQKRILCTYPKGVLYREGKKIPASQLIQSIKEEYFHLNMGQVESFKDLGDFLFDNSRFEEVILAIHRFS